MHRVREREGAAPWGSIVGEGGQLGRLLRTSFLADYFVNDSFRGELRRVLNRGECAFRGT
jgi:hypothetical protein